MIFDILVLSSGPIFLIVWFFYHLHTWKRINLSKSVNVFLFTFFLGFVALVIETQISKYTVLYLDAEELLNKIGFLFFAVSFTEEIIKILPVLIFVYKKDFFEEPYDAIFYTIIAGASLSFFENNLYIWSEGFGVVIPRTFLALPAHTLTAAFSGYFIGLAFLSKSKKTEIIYIFVGLFIAMLLHFAYNLIFTIIETNQLLIGIIFLVVFWGIALKLMKKHIKLSPYKPHNLYFSDIF